MLSIFAATTAALAFFLMNYALEYFRSPLKQFDGPFWAKFTDFWRLFNTTTFRIHEIQLQLHKRYGPAVRYGPNCISLNDPALIKTIYNARGSFVKSEFYSVNAVFEGGQIYENIFSTRSNAYHKQFIRPIQKIYSMGNILTLEPLADKTIATFCRRLDEEFVNGSNAGRVCDLGAWLLLYAWDVVGEVTFDETMGFLEKGGDINDMLRISEQAVAYFGVVPRLDNLLAKNPFFQIGPPSFEWATRYCTMRMTDRFHHKKETDKDFLDRFIRLKDEFPNTVTDNTVVGYMLINILAGADTTAITLRTIIYYLLKNPDVNAKLLAELVAANLQTPVSYHTAEQLPYLSSVIREAMRIHPAVGLLLERIVPDGGLFLPDGRFIPAGTIVGMNAWVVQRNKCVFGEDADAFRPERWLRYHEETGEEYEARLKMMKDADLSFGAGNRICIGSNLAMMQLYKVIPTLLLNYEMRLTDPDVHWEVKNTWFMLQKGINVQLEKR